MKAKRPYSNKPSPRNPENKVCSKCYKEFDKSNFAPLLRTKDGLYPQCRDCDKKIYLKRRERMLVYNKEYKLKNPEKYREIIRKTATRPEYKVMRNLRDRLKKILKENSINYDSTRLRRSIGCTRPFLVKHIESQWQEGMSWENYGLHGWHIDHIRPISSFDLTDPIERSLVNHWSNLQPLWAEDNLRKSDFYSVSEVLNT